MAIPDYQSVMLPLLRVLQTGDEVSLRDAISKLADDFELTDEERRELLPSGRQPTFNNRVGWARTYMKKAGLIESTKRAHFRITSRGRQILSQNPQRIDVKFLEQFKEFVEFRSLRRERTTNEKTESDDQTPVESLEKAYAKLREALAAELLETVRASSPDFFEQLVVDVLVKMGYGGSRREAGQAVGKSGDEGIDGIIKEDRLGLDIIYIQAKRWGASVGRPEVQKFAGALQGQRAKKGIMITTSDFSREARGFAESIESKIILINGEQLADLMIDHEVGVSRMASYDVKRVDQDYFADE